VTAKLPSFRFNLRDGYQILLAYYPPEHRERQTQREV